MDSLHKAASKPMLPLLTAPVKNLKSFKTLVDMITAVDGYRQPIGFGIAHVTPDSANNTLLARYPIVNWQENFGSAAVMLYAARLVSLKTGAVDQRLRQHELVLPIDKAFVDNLSNIFAPFKDTAKGDKHPNVQVIQQLASRISLKNFRLVMLFANARPKTVESAYLKLYALSTCKAAPGTISVDNIDKVLPTLGWANGQPVAMKAARDKYLNQQMDSGATPLTAISQFSRLLSHIYPRDVIIEEGARVRLGAHLAPGTQVGSTGSVDINAGTLGASTINGHIMKGSTIGKDGYIGHNATLGVSLGGGCDVDDGLHVLSDSTVLFEEKDRKKLIELNSDIRNAFMYARKSSVSEGYLELQMHRLKGADFLHIGDHTDALLIRPNNQKAAANKAEPK